MALIKRTGLVKSVLKAAVTVKKSYDLPDEMNEPSSDLRDYSILFYGAKKIGKTSFCARFDGAFFMSTEPGARALRVFKVEIRDWKTFLGYVDTLEANPEKYKTVVVDTIDLAYEYCFNHICKSKGIKHPNEENDFGATWREISEEFKSAVMRLLQSGRGAVFISHDVEREIEKRDGSKIDRTQPTMARAAMGTIEAVVDIMANYFFDGKNRYVRIEGEEEVVSGCRLEENFIRKGGEPRVGGDKIKVISMGTSASEGYDNFIAAFNNEQIEVDASVKVSSPVKKSFLMKKVKG